MPGTPASLEAGFSTTDASSYATAAFTPTGSAKLIAFVCVGHRTVTPSAPSSLSAHSVTWTKIAEVLTSNSTWQCSIWEATAPASPGSAAMTINLSATAESCTWRIVESTDAVEVQSKVLATSSANPSLTLDNAIGTDGICLGFLLNNNNTTTITAGSGYTDIGTQQSSGTAPVFKQVVEYDMTGTTTVAFTASGTVVRGLIGLELGPAGATLNETPSDTVGVTDSLAATVKKSIANFFVGISDAVFITVKKAFSDNVGITSNVTLDTGEPPLELGPDMSLVDQKRLIVRTIQGLSEEDAAKLSIMDLLHLYWSMDFPVAHAYDGSESGLTPKEEFSTMDHHSAVESGTGLDLNWIRDVVE